MAFFNPASFKSLILKDTENVPSWFEFILLPERLDAHVKQLRQREVTQPSPEEMLRSFLSHASGTDPGLFSSIGEAIAELEEKKGRLATRSRKLLEKAVFICTEFEFGVEEIELWVPAASQPLALAALQHLSGSQPLPRITAQRWFLRRALSHTSLQAPQAAASTVLQPSWPRVPDGRPPAQQQGPGAAAASSQLPAPGAAVLQLPVSPEEEGAVRLLLDWPLKGERTEAVERALVLGLLELVEWALLRARGKQVAAGLAKLREVMGSTALQQCATAEAGWLSAASARLNALQAAADSTESQLRASGAAPKPAAQHGLQAAADAVEQQLLQGGDSRRCSFWQGLLTSAEARGEVAAPGATALRGLLATWHCVRGGRAGTMLAFAQAVDAALQAPAAAGVPARTKLHNTAEEGGPEAVQQRMLRELQRVTQVWKQLLDSRGPLPPEAAAALAEEVALFLGQTQGSEAAGVVQEVLQRSSGEPGGELEHKLEGLFALHCRQQRGGESAALCGAEPQPAAAECETAQASGGGSLLDGCVAALQAADRRSEEPQPLWEEQSAAAPPAAAASLASSETPAEAVDPDRGSWLPCRLLCARAEALAVAAVAERCSTAGGAQLRCSCQRSRQAAASWAALRAAAAAEPIAGAQRAACEAGRRRRCAELLQRGSCCHGSEGCASLEGRGMLEQECSTDSGALSADAASTALEVRMATALLQASSRQPQQALASLELGPQQAPAAAQPPEAAAAPDAGAPEAAEDAAPATAEEPLPADAGSEAAGKPTGRPGGQPMASAQAATSSIMGQPGWLWHRAQLEVCGATCRLWEAVMQEEDGQSAADDDGARAEPEPPPDASRKRQRLDCSASGDAPAAASSPAVKAAAEAFAFTVFKAVLSQHQQAKRLHPARSLDRLQLRMSVAALLPPQLPGASSRLAALLLAALFGLLAATQPVAGAAPQASGSRSADLALLTLPLRQQWLPMRQAVAQAAAAILPGLRGGRPLLDGFLCRCLQELALPVARRLVEEEACSSSGPTPRSLQLHSCEAQLCWCLHMPAAFMRAALRCLTDLLVLHSGSGAGLLAAVAALPRTFLQILSEAIVRLGRPVAAAALLQAVPNPDLAAAVKLLTPGGSPLEVALAADLEFAATISSLPVLEVLVHCCARTPAGGASAQHLMQLACRPSMNVNNPPALRTAAQAAWMRQLLLLVCSVAQEVT